MTQTRRAAAAELADEILADLELSRISSSNILKKTSRLARLLDDTEASAWLRFEMSGYGEADLSREASRAATRSGRATTNKEGEPTFWIDSLARLEGDLTAGTLQLKAASDGNASKNTGERTSLRRFVANRQALIGLIIGSIHSYVAEKSIELRFGAVVEGAFAAVRNEVDAKIADLVPDAATKLAAAFENASSDNPEQWANATATCRRLLKAIADVLRPPGEPVKGRPMTDDKYINRLVDWIQTQTAGNTIKGVVASDLEDFGKRIDALDNAGHKGAHAEVTRYDASRFITGAYLLIGDILRLQDETESTPELAAAEAEPDGTATSESPDAIASDPVS